jgi:hypothetical protein
MIGHQVAFLDLASLPPGQAVKYGAEVLLDFPKTAFLRYFGMIFAVQMWHGSGYAAAS